MINLIKKLDYFLFKDLYNQYTDILKREILGSNCQTLLDVGCGSDSPVKHFSKMLQYSVGIDSFKLSIDKSKSAGIHSEYKLMDVLKVGRIFKKNSFDCVVALDLIEHLRKEDGIKLIELMEKIARKRVIIFTPNGFLSQREYDGNKFQVHLSGWTVEEMRAKGYKVIGINGWKPLMGERANIVWWPRFFWKKISLFSQVFTENSPKRAFQILCIKNVTKLPK